MDTDNLHPVSKAIIVLLVGVLVYVIAFSLLSRAVVPDRPLVGHMMGNFNTWGNTIVNGVSIGAGLVGMLLTSILLFRKHEERTGTPHEHRDEFSIMKRALTKDEAALLEKVREVEDGITQDSLRFRLGWSKAKVSTMLGNLDRMGLVQRERYGKTYKVYYQEKEK